ncbi:hypothetical protein [Mycobacterium tuberculosis]|uniref:hypothetical protein n=1 Tax=Mycobacterium tuberculosis TaxID=1773 RepID=UPI003D7C26C8
MALIATNGARPKRPPRSRPPRPSTPEMWSQDAMAMYGYAGALGSRYPADPVHRAGCRLPTRPAWRPSRLRLPTPPAPRLVLSKRRCRS